MSRSTLRWWLWTCCTFVVMVVAGMQGFYRLLLEHDVTRLSFCIIAIYLIATAWVGLVLRQGGSEFGFIWHTAAMLPYVGFVGTCWGLYLALDAFDTLPKTGQISIEFIVNLLIGFKAKLLVTMVGVVGYIFLSTQLRIVNDV